MSDGLRMSGYLASQLTNASRKLSGFWNTCPIPALQNGVKDGVFFHDDFLGQTVQAANVAATATTLADPWTAFTDATAGSTIANGVDPTDAVGTMTLNITTSAEGMHLGMFCGRGTGGGTTAITGALKASDGTASTGLANAASAPNLCKVWLESRLKVSTIGANEITLFFGLMERSRIITLGTLASTSAAAAVDHVGFLKKGTGTSALGTTTGNGTSTDVDTAAATLVADTYIKLGLTWDGTSGTLGLLTFYVNGTANATTLTSASTQFPLGEGMSPMIGAISGTTAGDDIVTFDWVAFAYQRS